MYTVIQSKDLLKKIQNVNWVQLHIVVNKHLFSIKNEIAYMYINSLYKLEAEIPFYTYYVQKLFNCKGFINSVKNFEIDKKICI